jgi:uncharacterized RDD family membrane protein YckC
MKTWGDRLSDWLIDSAYWLSRWVWPSIRVILIAAMLAGLSYVAAITIFVIAHYSYWYWPF